MITRKLSRIWTLLVVVVFGVSPAWSQSVHDGTISGTVATGQGERLPGVTVRITSPALVTAERQAMSDSDGRFIFLSLPPGTYKVTSTLQGFKTSTTPNVVIHSGDKVALNVNLEVGAYSEEMVVQGAAPVVDTKSSTIDTTFTKDLLDRLPTARSAFYDLAITAPGMASVGSDESWLPSPSAFGSAANENLFLVNGVNATNPRGAPWGSLVNVNYNTVEEVKILSLGSKAEYGSFSGAAIDVLTKSGSNDIRGDVAYYSMVGNAADNSRCGTLNADGMCTGYGGKLFYSDPNDVLTTKPKENWEASLTLGGPILKDRIWFYGGYAKYGAETDTPLFEPLATWDSKIFDVKLTGDFNARHRAWLAYHTEDQTAGNNTWGQTWDRTMVYNQPRDNDTLQFQYQWVMSDRDLFAFKSLGFKTQEHPTIPNETGHPGYINWWKWIGTQSIGVGGDFPYVEGQKSKRNTLQADYTHYAQDFLGQHEMKFGVQYTRAQGNWMGGYFHGYANFAYPYPWDYGPAKDWWFNDGYWGTKENPVFPIYNNKLIRNPWLTVRKSGSDGVFLDDTWTLNNRLTLNLGLRYDRMTASYGEGAVYELPTKPEDINNPKLLRTREATGNVFDFKTWSPRLGFAWTLTEDQKTVLRAHVGRYYAPLGVESLRRLGPDMEPSTQETWLYFLPMSLVDLNKNGKIDFNEVRPATRQLAGRKPDQLLAKTTSASSWSLQVAPGTSSPYTDQFNISVQRQIGSNLSVEAGYIFKHTKDLLTLRPFNTDTGQYWEWVERPYTTRSTEFKTSVWEIALKDYNKDGKVDVADAKFIGTHTDYRAVNIDSFIDGADRTYHGLQVVFTRRYTNRWQGLAAINWNQSDGLAPRTVDQNWYIDGPMIMDTPFGSSMNHFQNNTEGPLPMTPKWMVKVSGSYTIPRIETDLGVRYRYDSGRPLFPIEGIPTFASWMSDIQPGVYLGTWADQIVAGNPKDNDWMPATSIVDLSISKKIDVGRYGVSLSIDALNALNEGAPNRIGFREGDYGRVYGIVQPRTYRAGIKFLF